MASQNYYVGCLTFNMPVFWTKAFLGVNEGKLKYNIQHVTGLLFAKELSHYATNNNWSLI